MKVAFLGTPEFAVNILKALIDSKHEIVAVITNPDKKGNRGNKTIHSPVKQFAEREGLRIIQSENINFEVNTIKKIGADIGVTAAYGQILREEILQVFRYGIINVHASLLPKYRGASPVQCALLNGEKEVGVTIMKTVLAVDAGDILNVKRILLKGDENASECLEVLSQMGGEAVVETLDQIESGFFNLIPQEHEKASFCKKISKEDGLIDFEKETAMEIFNKIKAFHPWPSVYFETKYGTMKIKFAIVKKEIAYEEYAPGMIADIGLNSISVVCKAGMLEIIQVQIEGGKPMPIRDFLLGRPFYRGDCIQIKK